MGGMVSTLVCDVRRRSPIAMVSMYGTLDQTSAADCLVTLRDCIADAPTAMLLDVGHVSMRPDRALEQLVTLFSDARAWPGTHIGLCAATEATTELFDAYDKDQRPDFFDDVNAGLVAASRLPVAPRETIALGADANSPALAPY